MKKRWDQRRHQIQEAALALLMQGGYEALTLEAVADELGCTKQALYHYFPSKQELVRSILLDALEDATDNMDRILAEGVEPIEALKRLVQLYVEDAFTRQSFFNVYYETLRYQREILQPEEKRRLEQARKEMGQRIVDLVHRGIERGVFVERDPQLLGALVLGMVAGVLSHRRMPGLEGLDPQRLHEEILNVLMRGILKKEVP